MSTYDGRYGAMDKLDKQCASCLRERWLASIVRIGVIALVLAGLATLCLVPMMAGVAVGYPPIDRLGLFWNPR